MYLPIVQVLRIVSKGVALISVDVCVIGCASGVQVFHKYARDAGYGSRSGSPLAAGGRVGGGGGGGGGDTWFGSVASAAALQSAVSWSTLPGGGGDGGGGGGRGGGRALSTDDDAVRAITLTPQLSMTFVQFLQLCQVSRTYGEGQAR